MTILGFIINLYPKKSDKHFIAYNKYYPKKFAKHFIAYDMEVRYDNSRIYY